jgi:HlyD family secretion protein
VVTYTTIINAENDQLKLKPGMTANITIYTQEDTNALLVSAKATKFKPDSTIAQKYNVQGQQRKTNGKQTGQMASDTSATEKSNKPHNKNKTNSPANDTSNLKKASVWVLNGNTLTRRSIRIGLEDGTQVQVLSGLSPSDEVVDGVQQATTKGSQNAVQRSPFIPQRRPSNRPAGGSGGGGGGGRPS